MIKVVSTHKKIIISVLCGVAIVIAGSFAWIVLRSPSNIEDELIASPLIEDVQITALDRTRSDGVDAGLAFYDDEIDRREDSGQKRQLLLYKSSFAQAAGRFDDALASAQEADKIESDIATTIALAAAYEVGGDKRRAISYYEKVLEILPKEGIEARDNYVFELKIEELRQ